MATGTASLQYDFEERDEGLFVIIKQLTHKLNYHDRDWGDEPVLNYDADEERLLKLFNLQKLKQSSNLLTGEDLTNENGIEKDLTNEQRKKRFKNFMQQVVDYKKDKIPAFIMFFLMSHGFENGDFLLASHGENGKSEEQCCLNQNGEKHTREGQCFARNVVKDVISKVCEAYPEETIPKIFMIQCCRGGIEANIDGRGEPHEAVPSETELFIPSYKNVFVFRASVEGYVSWVLPKDEYAPNDKPGGSLFLQSFCEALEELKNSVSEYQTLVKNLKEQQGEAQQRLVSKLQTPERREGITGGWIMNVCQRTTALVTNFIVIEIIPPSTALAQLLKDPKTNDIICADENTLRKDLAKRLLSKLEGYKRVAQNKAHIDAVIQDLTQQENKIICTKLIYMVECITNNVDVSAPNSSALNCSLNLIVSEIQKKEPEDPLRKFLSQCDLYDWIFIEDTKRKLLQNFLDSLTEYKSHPFCQHQAEVDRIITACNANQCIHAFFILRYLWYNVSYIIPVERLLASGMPVDEKSSLEKDLKTIIKEIQGQQPIQQPYSKQQPHISSSLCKKLSCTKMLKI